jgi:hypothetical protein
MVMPDLNSFANVALAGVIVSAIAILFSKRPEDTCFVLIMAAIMFLPVGANFKIPKVPPLDRDTLPYLVFFLAYLVRRYAWVARSRLGRGLDSLILLSMVAALFTFMNNREPVFISKYDTSKVLKGLDLNDGLAMAGVDLLRMGIPFVLGRLLIRSPRDATRLLGAFAVAGLVHSLFILYEVRMSPQLHSMIYGAAPRADDFSQSLRWGGYRPVVFMPHGLAVALFACNVTLAAFILVRNRARLLGLSWKPFAFYLFFILVACKSLASLIYAVFALPLVAFARARTQLRVAVLAGLVVLFYPVLRGGDFFPTKPLISLFASFSTERAQSLEFRVFNEDQLLDHARKQVYFGWGSYGRNSVYDLDTGKEASTFDGEWIILFAMRGAVGAGLAFMLLLAPVFLALRRLRRIPDKREQLLLAGLAVMVAVSVADLIPNGLFLNYPYFLAGSLFGLQKILTSAQRQPGVETMPASNLRDADFATAQR